MTKYRQIRAERTKGKEQRKQNSSIWAGKTKKKKESNLIPQRNIRKGGACWIYNQKKANKKRQRVQHQKE